jgi:hypothetical protein
MIWNPFFKQNTQKCSSTSPVHESMVTFVQLWWKRSRSDLELSVSRVFKLFLILLKLKPILTYFLRWWWLYTLIRKINGESSWFLKLGFRFNLFRSFQIFTSIHRLFSIMNLRWWLWMRTRRFSCVYLDLFGDSNKKILRSFLIVLVSIRNLRNRK